MHHVYTHTYQSTIHTALIPTPLAKPKLVPPCVYCPIYFASVGTVLLVGGSHVVVGDVGQAGGITVTVVMRVGHGGGTFVTVAMIVVVRVMVGTVTVGHGGKMVVLVVTVVVSKTISVAVVVIVIVVVWDSALLRKTLLDKRRRRRRRLNRLWAENFILLVRGVEW